MMQRPQVPSRFPQLHHHDSAPPAAQSLLQKHPYQRSTAQQDDKDYETLKPAVLHDLVAGFPNVPPQDPGGLSLVCFVA